VSLLPYVTQCVELRKIEKLEPAAPLGAMSPPALLATEAARRDDACTVCGSARALRCTGCGAIAYCSAEHQTQDWYWHARVCANLREIAEDTSLVTAIAPGELCDRFVRRDGEARVPKDWTSYLGYAPDSASPEHRVFTSFASRPLTLIHWIHRLELGTSSERLSIHVMGASQAEVTVPSVLYEELLRFLPAVSFDIVLVGPELPEVPASLLPQNERLRLRLVHGLYRRELWEHVGRPDILIGFNCGLIVYRTWGATIPGLIGSGPPIVLTSYRRFEQDTEARLVESIGAVRVTDSEPNPFASLSARRSHTIANDVTWDNAFAMAVR
jgi:hypothetical protein